MCGRLRRSIVWLLAACLLLQSTRLAYQSVVQAQYTNVRSPVEIHLPIYTFHGTLVDDAGALQPAIIHVLLKAKQQRAGDFLVRTLSFLERTDMQGGHSFAPVIMDVRLNVYIEHKPAAASTWQELHFTQFAMLVAQGPFIHETTISADIAAEGMRLRVLDWPMYYTLNLNSSAGSQSQNLLQPQFDGSTFRNAIVIGDIHCDLGIAAELIATHMAYHLALGFDFYLVYGRGQLLQALSENTVTAKYMTQGQLLPVSLDMLQIPIYEAEWAVKPAYEATKLIAYNHAALLLWQERTHLAVIDPDELWAPRTPLTSVHQWFETCYRGTDLLSVSRLEVVCDECTDRGVPELQHFHQTWSASNTIGVLSKFSHVTNFHSDPKSIFNPDKVGQVWLHRPAVQPEAAVTDVHITNETDLKASCVVVVHLVNLFESRVPNVPAASSRHQWLGQRRRSRLRTHNTEYSS